MSIDWESILGNTSYEDAVYDATEKLENTNATKQNLEEAELTEEKVLLAEAHKTINHGYSEIDYDDIYNDDVKTEGAHVELYAGEGDIIEGKVNTWKDFGPTESSESLPFIISDSSCFELNVKTGDVHVTGFEEDPFDTGASLIKNNMELLYEALRKYDVTIAEALDGNLHVLVK